VELDLIWALNRDMAPIFISADVVFTALSLRVIFTFFIISHSLKQLFKNNDKFTSVWDSTTLKHLSKNDFKTLTSRSIKCTVTPIKL
jgi:hypothetical protein